MTKAEMQMILMKNDLNDAYNSNHDHYIEKPSKREIFKNQNLEFML